MPNWSTASKVQTTIRAGDDAANRQALNRSKINRFANCDPPIAEDLAEKIGLKINVNFGDLMLPLAEARRQWFSAFWGAPQFFKIELPFAPVEKASQWSAFISKRINSMMRKSMKWFCLHDSRCISVISHGIGPMYWDQPDGWCPRYISVEDLRIPTDTTIDFENLGWFAVRRQYLPGELLTAICTQPGWDKAAVANILKSYKEVNWDTGPNAYDWETQVEKFYELVKQDGGYYMGDAMPSIPMWHFYFKDNVEGGKEKWFLRIVPDQGATKGANDNKFIWQSDEPVADHWKHILHLQFGDIANVAPAKYHSIRSLGFALMEPTYWTNLTRCRLMQHIHDNFNVWLGLSDPSDRGRAAVQEFAHMAVIKPGVRIIPQTERHQVDANLVEMGMANTTQIAQRASSSYTHDTDTGTNKEKTAFETRVDLERVNAMMSGIMLRAFFLELQAYMEIGRRFCKRMSSDEDVIKFRQDCLKFGIPEQFLDSDDQWEITAVTPLGMGNPTLAQAEAEDALKIRPLLDPSAQQEALHDAVVTKFGPERAARWVKFGKPPVSDAQRDAQSIFGTLMQGVPVMPREGLSPIEQIETMIQMIGARVAVVEQLDNTGSPEDVRGLMTAVQYCQVLMQRASGDEAQKPRLKQYGDALGKLMNIIRAFDQRQKQAAAKAQQQQGANGDGGKMMMRMMEAKQKAQIKAAEFQQKMKQDQEQFVRDQRRQDASAFSNIQRNEATAASAQKMRMLGGDEEN